MKQRNGSKAKQTNGSKVQFIKQKKMIVKFSVSKQKNDSKSQRIKYRIIGSLVLNIVIIEN